MQTTAVADWSAGEVFALGNVRKPPVHVADGQDHLLHQQQCLNQLQIVLTRLCPYALVILLLLVPKIIFKKENAQLFAKLLSHKCLRV